MKNTLIFIASVVVSISFTVAFIIFSVGKQPVLLDNNNNLLYSDEKLTSAENDDVDDNLSEDNILEKPVIPEPVIKKISFLATGDNLIHGTVFKDAALLAEGTNKEYNFVPMYEHIRDDVERADLAFINQEGPTAGKDFNYSGYPTFNAPQEVGDALCEIGFDIINLANNHMLDKGEKGYIGTINFWDTKPDITAIGGYTSFEDYDDFDILEKNGIKIAFISFTYGTNGMKIPSSSELYVPLISEEEIERMSKKARESADVVIASIHWGNEDWFEVSDEQKKYAQIFADCNVDVVLGHHPHVLEPIEWKQRPDGGKTLVVYSLGNLLSGMKYSRNMLGCLLKFDIVKIDDNPVSIENVIVEPTMCQYNNNVRAFKIYKFKDYNAELASKHGCRKYESKISMNYLNGLIDKTIPEEFLADEYKDTVAESELNITDISDNAA